MATNTNSTRILDQFNTQQTMGKFAGEENRNPKSISQSSAGPYAIRDLSYPEDISSRADLQHFIVFYINARAKTKFKQQTYVDVDVSANGQNRATGNVLGRIGYTATGLAVGAATGTAISAATDKFTGFVGKLNKNAADKLKIFKERAGVKASLAAGAVTGGAAAATIAGLQSFSDTFSISEPVRVTDAIMLPIDSIPSVKYSVKYKDFDFGILGGLLGGSSAIDTTLTGRAQEGLLAGIASLGKIATAGAFNIGEVATQGVKLAAKVATNPFKEVMFEAIDFRTFSFKYTFLPKSESEVHNVRRIIDLFKFHMHPELSDGGLFYVYPSEFEMQYYFRGEENTFLHKISTCVLTDMQVDYGSQFFSSFDDGAPTEIIMSLTFKELELLTKERIIKGY
jgi:hypothetical protein